MVICINRNSYFVREVVVRYKFEFVITYGRRRVGKTALINRFIEGKIHFQLSQKERLILAIDGLINIKTAPNWC